MEATIPLYYFEELGIWLKGTFIEFISQNIIYPNLFWCFMINLSYFSKIKLNRSDC
jgi:hypothetical protein